MAIASGDAASSETDWSMDCGTKNCGAVGVDGVAPSNGAFTLLIAKALLAA